MTNSNDDLRKLAVKLAKTLCNTNVGGWAYSNNTSVEEILTTLQRAYNLGKDSK